MKVEQSFLARAKSVIQEVTGAPQELDCKDPYNTNQVNEGGAASQAEIQAYSMALMGAMVIVPAAFVMATSAMLFSI